MKHLHMVSASHAYQNDFEGDDNGRTVHFEGCGLIGSHTLCGFTDLVGVKWADTKKPVTCAGCLAIRKHVLGK